MKQLIYQLLPRLWGNGRFSGVDRETLTYLKEGLGMDILWCTGIIRHAVHTGPEPQKVVKGEAGSPYAITDYYDVNPYLADNPAARMEEFRALVSRVHEAGLKLLIDFVPNHVAREYSGAASPKGVRPLGADDNIYVHWSPDNDFFYYPGEPLCLPVSADDYREFPARASGNAFTPSPTQNDWYETVKLNYCDFHTRTWDKMRDIVLFWAGMGVDGFRCDMVELVPPEFMKWLIASVKERYPSLLFVAEVYQKEKYRMYVEEVGFDLLYDKSGLYDTLRAVTCSNASAEGISWNWQALGNLQPRMLNFLENHDEQRVASDFFCGSADAAWAALAVSLLQNDASFMLYFGQEIGERGMDNEPFSGINGRTSIFDWWTVASLQRLRAWISNKRSGLQPRERSLLKRYRELLQLARTAPFSQGRSYDLCYCQDGGFRRDRQYVFARSDGREAYLVAANFGASQELTFRIPPEALDYLGVKAVRTVYTLQVPEKDFVVIPIQ